MSEFQYYNFQKFEGQLSHKEVDAISKVSSRVNINGNQATFVYNYGDFRGNPKEMLAHYFDMMLYAANFGVKELHVRFASDTINLEALRAFTHENIICIEVIKDSIILSLRFLQEDNFDNLAEKELTATMASLLTLKQDILNNDYRSLYLTWLAHYSIDDPMFKNWPIPNDIHKLSPALESLAEFFHVDSKILKNIATKSNTIKPAKTIKSTNKITSNTTKTVRLSQLSPAEIRDYIEKIIIGKPLVKIKLKEKLPAIA